MSGRALERWSSQLAALLFALKENGRRRGVVSEFTDLPVDLTRMIAMAGTIEHASNPAVKPRSPLIVIGEAALRCFGKAVEFCASLGAVVLAAGAGLRGRARIRAGDISDFVRQVGADAFGIVAVVNFLVGGILAFVGAVQLAQFGAEIYIANLVGIATAREMAAIMTAIVLAGRTGAAFAAQLATMQGNEEIDALQTIGVSPYEHLVLPRTVALTAVMPFLYVYACALGLFGGLVVSVGMLDITATAFFEQTRVAVATSHFVIGAIKSVCFGALIAIVGCHIGLRAGRSAAEVGRAATASVVVSILGIIVVDAVFAVCTNILGV